MNIQTLLKETNPSSASILVLSISTVLVTTYFLRPKKKESLTMTSPEGRKLGRRISFTSASMAMGPFPTAAKVPEPIVNGALLFAPGDCPSVDDLVDVVKVVLTFERCAGVPVGTQGRNDWRFMECPKVDPRQMIRTVKIQGGDEVMYKTIEEHMQDNLREGRGGLPWWEILRIENTEGMSVCVFRIDHCIGDGFALVTLFEQIVTYSDGSSITGFISKSFSSKFVQKDNICALIMKAIKATCKVLTLPASKYDDKVVFREHIGKGMSYSGKRKAIIFNDVPVEFIKKIKNAAEVTINDVFFTCLSQALHDYCLHYNCAVMNKKGEKVQFRALLPIAFPRPPEETSDRTRTLRNKWVFVSASMGIGIANIMDRLDYVNTELSKIKKSPMAYCQLRVQETIPPKIPLNVARQTVFDLFTRHSLVFANVPGPARQCCFGGRKIVGVQILYNNLIPQVEILSYNGTFFMNLVLDPDEVPNSESIPIFFSKALVDLANELDVSVPPSVNEQSKRKLPIFNK